MQITVNTSEFLKTVQCVLTFFNCFSESSIHLAWFSVVLAKKMSLVSHKMVLIENKAVLLYVTVRANVMGFTTTI